ncbi:MAG: aminotransferase class V-fold PLP-dependent enzyme [Candidatus Kapabacteria bacterium]|nr:aminotransferase class V-fold PLP-dependent enzyme [Candidatus Kapabacteria bacterium]
MEFGKHLKQLWYLDENITFLNHGSFGATPKTVLEAVTKWQIELEKEPVEFFLNRYFDLIRQLAEGLGKILGSDGDSIVFVDNATTGINTVLKSIQSEMNNDDEILFTNHIYPAARNSVFYLCEKTGAKPIEVFIPYPMTDINQVTEIIKKSITPKTKLLLIDHIFYTCGIVAPLNEIIDICRKNGTYVLVDGAHAPGMIELKLDELQADWYTGNCHKWMFSPKGCAFLWTRKELQEKTKPLSISLFHNQGYCKEFDWTGTKNPALWLALNEAIDFIDQFGLKNIQDYNHNLLIKGIEIVSDITKIEFKTPVSYFGSLAAFELPINIQIDSETTHKLRDIFYNDYKIEIPFIHFDDKIWFRFSSQIYNEPDDYVKLGEAVKTFYRDYK